MIILIHEAFSYTVCIVLYILQVIHINIQLYIYIQYAIIHITNMYNIQSSGIVAGQEFVGW